MCKAAAVPHLGTVAPELAPPFCVVCSVCVLGQLRTARALAHPGLFRVSKVPLSEFPEGKDCELFGFTVRSPSAS